MSLSRFHIRGYGMSWRNLGPDGFLARASWEKCGKGATSSAAFSATVRASPPSNGSHRRHRGGTPPIPSRSRPCRAGGFHKAVSGLPSSASTLRPTTSSASSPSRWSTGVSGSPSRQATSTRRSRWRKRTGLPKVRRGSGAGAQSHRTSRATSALAVSGMA